MSKLSSIDCFRSLFEAVRKLPLAEPENTIFSSGGRGYYENPTSDLLAFFLRPDGPHGLGKLFMEALLDSIPPQETHCKGRTLFMGTIDHFSVEREKDTGGGGRIDFLLRGRDWVMLIENKIYHTQNNPFEDYERFGREVASGADLHLVILSPSGRSSATGWQGVSYEAYCAKLKERLGARFLNAEFSKWHLFAREFVIHIENELYAKSMNEEQIRLIEEYQSEITHLQKLKDDYRVFLISRLREIMSRFFEEDQIRIKDERWALRCRSEDWGQTNIAWWYSDMPKVEPNLSIYMEEPSDGQSASLENALNGICRMESWSEGRWRAWKTVAGFKSREEAEVVFAKLVESLNAIFPHQEKPIEGAAIQL